MRIFILLSILILVNSCAAFMAISSKQEPALKEIGYGMHSSEVENLLGFAEKILIMNSGRIEYYRFKSGTKPSLARGALHSGLSYGSNGLWEAVGMPFEEFNARDKYLAVTYDASSRVKDVEVIEINQR